MKLPYNTIKIAVIVTIALLILMGILAIFTTFYSWKSRAMVAEAQTSYWHRLRDQIGSPQEIIQTMKYETLGGSE